MLQLFSAAKVLLRDAKLSCYVRLMRQEDIDQVTEIDRESFPTEWPPVDYRHELENRLAHYIVACNQGVMFGEAEAKRVSGVKSRVKQLFNHSRFLGNESPSSGGETG